jgi:hypothetical protein
MDVLGSPPAITMLPTYELIVVEQRRLNITLGQYEKNAMAG